VGIITFSCDFIVIRRRLINSTLHLPSESLRMLDSQFSRSGAVPKKKDSSKAMLAGQSDRALYLLCAPDARAVSFLPFDNART
jgi:hypothetical protein